MFESAELGHEVDKQTYKAEEPALREALLAAQYDLLESRRFSVLILIGGVDGAGKGETVNLLNEWMDPRHIQTTAFGEPTEDEASRPEMWRFWRALPPKGKIGVFFGAWHTMPILRRTYGRTTNAELDQSMHEIARFERMLAAESVLLIKLWLHLSKERQRARLQSLSSRRATSWRVTDRDWKHFELYDTFAKVSERALRQTSTAEAPWIVVEGYDARYRSLTVGRAILDAMRHRLGPEPPVPSPAPAPAAPRLDGANVLSALDLTRSLDRDQYRTRLETASARLNRISRRKRFKKRRGAVVVFEGSDAAGKGGAIRRIAAALDARQYRIVPIAAPSEEERAQPYLWRFWRHIPGPGMFTIFDRSWYGRVLVERVEGFCTPSDWMRAYEEINDFEEQLDRHDIAVVKFWLQISADEQLRRFREREATGFKHYKITPDDWRNRERRADYEAAVADMVDRTSTELAPWTLIEAEDKYYARVRILDVLAARLETDLA